MSDARFNPEGLVMSKDYARTMEVVMGCLAQRRQEITVAGEGGRPLFCCRYDADAPKGTVMMVHGFTESADKFGELIHSLLHMGYSVVAYDQRGHGRSWRDPEISDLSLTHVDRFEEYVADLEAVCAQVLADMPKPWLLFAHSMGGAVSALFLEKHPDGFEKAALCAPMIAPNVGMPPALVRGMCAAAGAMGKSKRRVFVSKTFSGPEDFDTSCATGRARFDWYDAIRVANPLFQNNGPTYGWTREALRASRMILAPGEVEKIAVPVRVFTAESDSSVMPDAQEAFVQRLQDGKRTLVPGSRHEIYRSGDEALFPWWKGILRFLES